MKFYAAIVFALMSVANQASAFGLIPDSAGLKTKSIELDSTGKNYTLRYATVSGSSPQQYSFFLPPGTFRMIGVYTIAGNTSIATKGVWQIDSPSMQSASSVTREIAWTTANSGGVAGSDWDQTFKNLLAGVPQYFYSNADVMPLAYQKFPDDSVSSQGHYVYADMIHANSRAYMELTLTINKTCFDNWRLKDALFDQAGNPLAGIAHTCTANADLESFTFSSFKLKSGETEHVDIIAYPPGANLGQCAATPDDLVNIANNTISLADKGKAVTGNVDVTVSCIGSNPATPKTAKISIEPRSSLRFDPPTLTQGTNKVATVAWAVNQAGVHVKASGCVIPQDASAYLDWEPGASKVELKVSPVLPTVKEIPITCSGTDSQMLTIKPAPVGVLYPLHNDDAGSGIASATRDEKKVFLRWREANANGDTSYSALDSNYPSYPTASSDTEFICSEVDSNGKSIGLNLKFLPADFGATGTRTPMMELTAASDAITAQVKVLCLVKGKAFDSVVIEGSKSHLILNITNGKWDLAEPTEANPIIDVSGTSGNAKLQVYVPKATVPTADVPVVIFLYISGGSNAAAPGGAFVTSTELKLWDGKLDEASLIHTTVPASAAKRVIDVDLLLPKSAYAAPEFRVKGMVFYRVGPLWHEGWRQLTTPATEWDSTK